MEQLTAICFEDSVRMIAVGYKDLGPDEFWIRGHMPGLPILPGVVMCEIAAQLCSYFSQRNNLLGSNATLGFGGMNDVVAFAASSCRSGSSSRRSLRRSARARW